MRRLQGLEIRAVELGDQPALAALERAAPEAGSLVVRLEPRVGYLDLAARYPSVSGYVVVEPRGDQRIVGMLFSSLAPTQCNGAVVPGAYLFSLRVHPTARRRGVASALLAYAWARALEAGAELAWGAVMAGNEASLRTFARAGFTRTRDLAICLWLPAWSGPAGEPARTLRRGTARDLPALAEAFNRSHAEHNLWRPVTPERLGAELAVTRHGPDDVLLLTAAGGDILAAGAVFDLRRVLALRLLGWRGLPGGVNRVLAPLLAGLTPRPLILRQRALTPSHSGAGLSLLRSLGRPAGPRAILAAPVDRRDPAWPLMAGVARLRRPLHVAVKGAVSLDDRRPLSFI